MPHNVISARIKEGLARTGLNASELARRADVKTSFIYDILNGKSTNPSSIKLARVAEVLGTSLAYLAGAEEHENPTRLKDDPSEYASIPRIVAEASAGGGAAVISEEAEEYYYFRRNWIRERLHTTEAHLRMLYVRGDSMEPSLYDNDIILIDTSRADPSPPGIFVLFDGFGLVAKRLELVSGSEPPNVRIISDNPQYSTYERAVSETRIIGRVVWFAREI